MNRPRLHLYLAAALLSAGLAPTAAAATPSPPPASFLKNCSEAVFLGKRLEPRSMSGILQWYQDKTEGAWRAPGISTPVHSSAQVVLLHLWAHWCAPCRRDFEIYSALATRLPQQLYKKYGADASRSPVQFLYLAEDTPNHAMKEFLAGNADLLRGGGNFQDAGGRVMRELQRQLGCTVSLPLTLMLDKDQRVQASFVGSIESRREELLDTLVRLAKPTPTASQDVARSGITGGAL